MKKEDKHPCFNSRASGEYGRVHLPVAPDCNIQCSYCNRKFSCVNETRPGVTSSVLSPEKALRYLTKVRDKSDNISVVGIAGPGDPFADPDRTLETLRLVKEKFSDMIFCLSTNGFNLAPYVDELSELGVTHVTVTVNAVDPDLLPKIYFWVKHNGRVYRGAEAGAMLLEKQFESIEKLKEKNIVVKINTIILPGINDQHVARIAGKMREMKADIMNCIPVYPVEGTIFGDVEPLSPEFTDTIRSRAAEFMPQMRHCVRCRADAAGLLGKNEPEYFNILKECAQKVPSTDEKRPYVAVATYEGMLVNRHLGEADVLHIFMETENGYVRKDIRTTPPSGSGDLRWEQLADLITDCRALLVGGAGNRPRTILTEAGINVIEMSGLIVEGLSAVYKGTSLKTAIKKDMFKCGAECSGTGMGCG